MGAPAPNAYGSSFCATALCHLGAVRSPKASTGHHAGLKVCGTILAATRQIIAICSVRRADDAIFLHLIRVPAPHEDVTAHIVNRDTRIAVRRGMVSGF